MAVTYPYSLTAFADLLKIQEVVWSIQRNDELSGDGEGRVWQAELSDPLWMADVTLIPAYHDEAEQRAAQIRKLHGAQESFFLYNPMRRYPQFDPTGSILGSNTVTIGAVGTNRNSISLTGLPANYRITLADKGQIQFSSNPTRTYFFEFSETITAGSGGTTAQIDVFPHVPAGISAGATVILKKPACKVFIMPQSHNPGRARAAITEGQSFRVMERRR